MKCKFCLENQNLPFIFKDRNVESVSISIDTDTNKLVIEASNQGPLFRAYLKINFCPICGRGLKK